MSYFTINNLSPINNLSNLKKIHFLGVCGSAMGQLALTLHHSGFCVSGSDKEYYQPMSGMLRASGITLYQGFNPEHVPADCDLIVIGNSIRIDNPELTIIAERKLPFTCLPAAVGQLLARNRQPIVVSGTHGKSTTSALLAHILKQLGQDPGYLIGAHVPTLDGSFCLGQGELTVLEGDEYDSAFFAKVPKFTFYDPRTLIVTSIEFDHADIYSSVEQIRIAFTDLVCSRSQGDLVLACADDANIIDLLGKWRATSEAQVITFGLTDTSDWLVKNVLVAAQASTFDLISPQGDCFRCSIPLVGLHNVKNAAAAFIALHLRGFEIAELVNASQTFKGVARRLTLLVDQDDIKIFEDFAHHPSAVRVTLEALRSSQQPDKLWAVFEPRSNTSRRSIFQGEYAEALGVADGVIIKNVASRLGDENQELLDVGGLVAALRQFNTEAYMADSAEEILVALQEKLKPGSVAVLMSNGSFDGLVQQVQQGFGRR